MFVIVGALGAMPFGLPGNFWELDIMVSAELLQKFVLLGKARILTKVLEADLSKASWCFDWPAPQRADEDQGFCETVIMIIIMMMMIMPITIKQDFDN